MPVKLTINSKTIEADPGPSVFDYAERLAVRVPTSCRKQGRCRECLVEVIEGAERLSPPTKEESHLQGRFRLSCRARVTADSGAIVCHTLRRGAMRIESGAADDALPRPSLSIPPRRARGPGGADRARRARDRSRLLRPLRPGLPVPTPGAVGGTRVSLREGQ